MILLYTGTYISRRPRSLLIPCQSVVFNRAPRWHYIYYYYVLHPARHASIFQYTHIYYNTSSSAPIIYSNRRRHDLYCLCTGSVKIKFRPTPAANYTIYAHDVCRYIVTIYYVYFSCSIAVRGHFSQGMPIFLVKEFLDIKNVNFEKSTPTLYAYYRKSII